MNWVKSKVIQAHSWDQGLYAAHRKQRYIVSLRKNWLFSYKQFRSSHTNFNPEKHIWVSWIRMDFSRASLVAQLVENLPAMQEIWAQSLGWEDPLEKGTATHSNILAWRIPRGRKESDMTERSSLHVTSQY